jgi:hypothetical protein
MKISMRQLAEIAEKSPGYSVTMKQHGPLTNIRFARHEKTCRRDRFIVIADQGIWNSDAIIEIED